MFQYFVDYTEFFGLNGAQKFVSFHISLFNQEIFDKQFKNFLNQHKTTFKLITYLVDGFSRVFRIDFIDLLFKFHDFLGMYENIGCLTLRKRFENI